MFGRCLAFWVTPDPNWMELFDVEFNASSGPLSFFDAIQRAALETVSCAWRDQVRIPCVNAWSFPSGGSSGSMARP